MTLLLFYFYTFVVCNVQLKEILYTCDMQYLLHNFYTRF